MSATQALEAARAAGLDLRVDGQDLVLTAPAPPPPAVLDLLARHKTGVIALLRAGEDDWTVEDWRAFFDERAAIAEFEGGLSRRDAEALAHACCVAEWHTRHPERASPGQCPMRDRTGRDQQPFGPPGSPGAGACPAQPTRPEAWPAPREAEAAAAPVEPKIGHRSKTG